MLDIIVTFPVPDQLPLTTRKRACRAIAKKIKKGIIEGTKIEETKSSFFNTSNMSVQAIAGVGADEKEPVFIALYCDDRVKCMEIEIFKKFTNLLEKVLRETFPEKKVSVKFLFVDIAFVVP